jgi:hypothetical protein
MSDDRCDGLPASRLLEKIVAVTPVGFERDENLAAF